MEQEIETNETKEKDISKMSNAELLTKKPEERLPYITK